MIRYLDIAPDGHAFHAEGPNAYLNYLMVKLKDMMALELITIRVIVCPSIHRAAGGKIPWIYITDTTIAVALALHGRGGEVKFTVRSDYDDMNRCTTYDHRYGDFYGGGWARLGDVNDHVWERWEEFGLGRG